MEPGKIDTKLPDGEKAFDKKEFSSSNRIIKLCHDCTKTRHMFCCRSSESVHVKPFFGSLARYKENIPLPERTTALRLTLRTQVYSYKGILMQIGLERFIL